MTKIRQKQAKLTVSPYFFQVSARKIGHQNRDRKRETERSTQIKMNCIPSLIFIESMYFSYNF